MSADGPVILLGMDATEITLVERLLDEGRLPQLQALRERGCWGELVTQPMAFLSMVWPTFFNAMNVSHHGWYFNKLWRRERMRLEYAHPDWLPQKPFWDYLDPKRYRVALLDIPFSPAPPQELNGIYLNGWQNHDDFGNHTAPRQLWGQLVRRFGRPAMKPEFFGHQSVGSLLRLRKEMLASTEQFGKLCEHTLRNDRWDLLVAVFGSAHRGAHYLWDLSQVDRAGASRETITLLENACAELYQAWDAALGRIVAAAAQNAKFLIFALHGMGQNTGWCEHFGRIVGQIQSGGAASGPKRGLVYRVKKALPWKLVRQVTTRLPSAVNQALVPLWSQRMFDWNTTRFFPLPLDLNGYLRINLKGREAQGIVEPGAEYEALLGELEEAFMSFVDIETGERVAESVQRVDDLVSPDAPCRGVLPDLVVMWSERPSSESIGIRSPKYGEVRWERGAKMPSGRSGNHLGRGWYVAAGEGVMRGACDEIREAVDLIPTAFSWLGAEAPEHFQGRAIPPLIGAEATVA